ncbi:MULTISPECIES: glycosyltransferase family A protein [Azorhizobium]|uniref:Glycosyltransferase n=1 Tax=Azorhizobium caulinodans (strain ATCC 43989 / DSM 5975 / JCM 20966 / LMG 6465 / NBRC 14845 / NCIMB 13405 / ORS 571) TaxID=438753 RepID=A8HXN4_AZOC5|nr:MULTISPECIES: glycosyltransferase family 2 protein [Azorhizobium]TDT94472.1 glycosyltransferase involved in cell wall biosynthesis [Azorhizobium sp. AG788]BAF87519.1 glycosyltransferase [Azorhizobium caulinodans ORS 571]
MPQTTDAPVDITVVITAHGEGIIAGQSAKSAEAAIAEAERGGLRCEIVVVLDRADELTSSVLREALGDRARYAISDAGDPGGARNRGVAEARGTTVAFLDADDLWSSNWLKAGFAQITARPDTIAHSACNLVFGGKRMLWWHTDSEIALCDGAYLAWGNFWDALTIARTEIYRRFPFRANDLRLGFGHEDWHWNVMTLRNGVAHKPVPGTMHFKRARRGSQMEAVERVSGLPWPDAIIGLGRSPAS